MTQYRNTTRSTMIFPLALFLLVIPLAASGQDSMDADSPTSARERFYQKYRDKVRSGSSSQEDRIKRMEERKKEIEMRRQEMRKQSADRQEMRRDKIDAETDRMQGKAPAAAKKERERLDARRKAMQERMREKREARQEQIRKRHSSTMDKARAHEGNPDAGYTGGPDAAASSRRATPSIEERRRQIEERRKAILERSRARHDSRMDTRGRGTDGMPDAHISGSDVTPPTPRSHISGAPTSAPDAGDIPYPDTHISGN